MKVLQINAVPDRSTGKLAMEIHKSAEKNNAESLFVYTAGENKGDDCILVSGKAEQKIHALLSRMTGLQGHWSTIATKKIISIIKEYKPDVVHIHNIHANNVNIKLLFEYLIKSETAVCITLHDCYMFTGHCCYYTEADCNKWKQVCEHCPEQHNFNTSWFLDQSKRLFLEKKDIYSRLKKLAVVGVSKWIYEEASQSILNQATTMEYIYNWIDHDIFKPRKVSRIEPLQDKFVIMGVAQKWGQYKGIDDFIALANLLKNDEVIVLIGECTYDLPENIVHVERTKNAVELAEFYNMADVFVTPSRQETFGLVTAEALSCGTPVVVYNNTASPELVGANCGFVCKNLDIQDLYKNIKKIKRYGKAYFSEACVKFSREFFDLSKNTKKYYDIYRKLLGDTK